MSSGFNVIETSAPQTLPALSTEGWIPSSPNRFSDLLPPYLRHEAWVNMCNVIEHGLTEDVYKYVWGLSHVRDALLPMTEERLAQHTMIDFSERTRFDDETSRQRLNFLGFKSSNPKILDNNALTMLHATLGQFWMQKGTANVADYIAFVLDSTLQVTPLWSQTGTTTLHNSVVNTSVNGVQIPTTRIYQHTSYGSFRPYSSALTPNVVSDLPGYLAASSTPYNFVGPVQYTTPPSQWWFPTAHVRVNFTPSSDSIALQQASFAEILTLFEDLSNYNLVLEDARIDFYVPMYSNENTDGAPGVYPAPIDPLPTSPNIQFAAFIRTVQIIPGDQVI